jgi:uncharacterized protein (UPF0248 family)
MQTIQELLSRIRWDEQLASDNFEIGYFDRVEHRIIRVSFKELRFSENDHYSFEIIDEDEELHSIPYHRVREIYQNGILIWQRK